MIEKKLTRREFLKLAAAGATVATIPAAGRLLEPVLAQEPKYWIVVCDGPRCVAVGGDNILATVESVLGIKPGETSPDNKFHLETQNCLGVCGSAPNMVVEDTLYGGLTTRKVKKILAGLK